MAFITPNIQNNIPVPIIFNANMQSNDCELEIEVSFIPANSPAVDVSILLEVAPPSHFMFSNNKIQLSCTYNGVVNGQVLNRVFRLKKKVGFMGHPPLIIKITAIDLTNNVVGASSLVNPWTYQ